MTSPTVYLITGANHPRGIGLSLTTHILSTHESAFVYASARDPENATALQELKVKYPGRLAIAKYISGDVKSNSAVAKDIEERHGHVDTVLANAAMLNSMSPIGEVTAKEMEEHFHVNVIGAIVLFQFMLNLLKKDTNLRFITISTLGGSIGGPIIHHKLGSTAYSTSKAALNQWITRKIHFDNEWLVAFPLSPGGVQTDMYDFSVASNKSGVLKDILKSDPPTPAQAAVLLLKAIDGSTRKKDGGNFLNVDGTTLPW